MTGKLYIIGEQMDVDRLNKEFYSELDNQIQAEMIPGNELLDADSAIALMLIFELGKDLFSSGVYDILKHSLTILFRHIRPKKQDQEIKIVIGNRSCQIKTNFDLTDEQKRELAETALEEVLK